MVWFEVLLTEIFVTEITRKELESYIRYLYYRYEMYEPLHQLWLDYMRDSLQLHKQMWVCWFHNRLIHQGPIS